MAGGAAAIAAAVAQAIKASGAIVRVAPQDFLTLLGRAGSLSTSSRPLVVVATGGLFRTHYDYLTAYKGLVFFTPPARRRAGRSAEPLPLGGEVELVRAGQIWIPG